jgi:hypothetical protein
MGIFAETASVEYLYRLLTEENKCPFWSLFEANKWKFAISIFHFQETNESCCYQLVQFSFCGIPEMWRHGHGA